MMSRQVYRSGYGEKQGASVEKTFWGQTISVHPWEGTAGRGGLRAPFSLAALVRDLAALAHPLSAQVTDPHSIIGMTKRQRTYPAALASHDAGLVCIWEHWALIFKHQYETCKHSQCSQFKKKKTN